MPVDLFALTLSGFGGITEAKAAKVALQIIRSPFNTRYLQKDIRRIALAVAPTRIDFGGWSDTWFFLEHDWGFVFNLALDRLTFVVVMLSGKSGKAVYHAPDLGQCNQSIAEMEDEFVGHATQDLPQFSMRNSHLVVQTTAPLRAGLGSSGSVGVATLAALDAACGRVRSRRKLAFDAHNIEHFRMGHQCGIQDQVAAAEGSGALRFRKGKFPYYRRFELQIPPAMIDCLQTRAFLLHTGEGRNSSDEHQRIIAKVKGGGKESETALDTIRAMREAAKKILGCLEEGDWPKACRGIAENWEQQKLLDASATTKRIARIEKKVVQMGGMIKVGGAAGGGTMIVASPRDRGHKEEMKAELQRVIDQGMSDAKIMPLSLWPMGVATWTFTQEEINTLLA